MGLLDRDNHRTVVCDAEDFAYHPSGGPVKQWTAGCVLAAVPVFYGLFCLNRGYTTVFGKGGSTEATGEAGFWFAIAYIALGAFLHFHYFWGLSSRLWPYSQPLNVLSLMTLLPSLVYSLFIQFAY